MAAARLETTMVPDLLTVIITTSVTPSIPNTDLVSEILDGFCNHCLPLLDCRVVVVFDNYDQVTSRARLKKGQVTPQQADDWDLYKRNVKQLILEKFHGASVGLEFTTENGEAEYGSHHTGTNAVAVVTTSIQDKKVTFIEPSRRLGFGLAVRSALRVVQTPYVWIQQHDWGLIADIPVESILEVMQESQTDVKAPVKYVCFSAIRMLSYATSGDVEHFPMLKALTSELKGEFLPTQVCGDKVPLTPMFFWHDKPHIASTEHYLARVFPSRLAMLRGDFIEDKIGQRARAQMKEGLWSKWATWLYYPDQGRQLCLRHLQGRIWRGKDAQAKQIAIFRDLNLKRMQERDSLKTELTDAADNASDNDDHDDGVLGGLF